MLKTSSSWMRSVFRPSGANRAAVSLLIRRQEFIGRVFRDAAVQSGRLQ
jgi:hypothetical protein